MVTVSLKSKTYEALSITRTVLVLGWLLCRLINFRQVNKKEQTVEPAGLPMDGFE